MNPVAVPLLSILAVLTWRFAGDDAIGLAASGMVLAAALAASWKRTPSASLLAVQAGLGLVVSLLGLFEGWWPCEAACSTGEEYSQVATVPVLAWSAGGLLLLLGSALRDRSRHARVALPVMSRTRA